MKKKLIRERKQSIKERRIRLLKERQSVKVSNLGNSEGMSTLESHAAVVPDKVPNRPPSRFLDITPARLKPKTLKKRVERASRNIRKKVGKSYRLTDTPKNRVKSKITPEDGLRRKTQSKLSDRQYQSFCSQSVIRK